jgi:hypothetical protein
VVGQTAVLPLTGRFVAAGESASGPYVKFEVDERWGFAPQMSLVMDLEAFRTDCS